MQWPRNMKVRPITAWHAPVTPHRRRSDFSADWAATLELLDREIRALGARDVVLQVAIAEHDFRLDGYPRAQAKAAHPGVVLSLESKYGPLSWPCDTFTTWQDNIRAIALAMEALRKVDRYGVTRNGEQYTGWKALPSGSGTESSHMTSDVALAVLLDAVAMTRPRADAETLSVEQRFKIARRNTHPDRHDGDRTLWNRVEQAAAVLGLL